MSQLWISAGIKVCDGKKHEEARKALNALVQATRDEPGNLSFQVLQHRDNPELFTLWECWTHASALEQHFEAEHTKEYLSHNWTELVYIEKLTTIKPEGTTEES